MAILLFCCGGNTARPAEPVGVFAPVTPADAGFAVRRWGIEDGLPLDRLRDMALTPDGFLWLAADGQGLARFDGREFAVWDPTTQPSLPFWSVTELLCDSQGRLWIRAGRQLAVRNADGKLRVLKGRIGGRLAEDAQGNILVQGWDTYEVTRIRGDTVEPLYRDPGRQTVRDWGSLRDILCDPMNRVWGVDRVRGLFYELTDRGPRIEESVSFATETFTKARLVLRLSNGQIGILFREGLAIPTPDGWQPLHRLPKRLDDQLALRTGLCDSTGRIWFATADHQLVLWTPGDSPRRFVGPILQNVRDITRIKEDAAGGIWLSAHTGLYHLRPAAVRTWVPPGPGRPRILGLMMTHDGTLWMSQAGGPLFRWPPGQPQPTPTDITQVNRDLSPGLRSSLLGSDGMQTVWRVIPGVEGEAPRADRVWDGPGSINAILESSTQGLWVAVGQDLYRDSQGTFLKVDLPLGPVSGDIAALAEDGSGGLWAVRITGELYRRSNDEWTFLGSDFARQGQSSPGFTLTPDGTVWIACRSRELRCFKDGQWRQFGSRHLDLPRGAMGIVSDLKGGLWWATHAEGVFHLDPDSARALAEGRLERAYTTRFGLADGLKSLAGDGYFHTPIRDNFGRIWWPTAQGASVVDPAEWERVAQRTGRPGVFLSSIVLDGDLVPQERRNPRIPIPPGTDRIDLNCSLVEISAPERAQLEFRLVGYDADWVPARQPMTATYQKLPPGEYRFEARAAGQGLRWGDPQALVTLVALPAWWQTAWFRMAGIAGVAGLLWFTRWKKLRQWQREKARREAFSRQLIQSQEVERARIAGELHDSLGQSLLIAKNQLFLIREAAEDTRLHARLDEATQNIGAALEEARTISHRLRPFQLDHLGLTKTVHSLIKRVTESTRIPIESVVAPMEGLLPRESEVMVYRILQEALANVVKHADASRIWVHFERHESQLRLTVRDDGRGFDTAELADDSQPSRGLGLSGFEERTRLLRGHFTCRSAPGSGTTLAFEFPVLGRTPHEPHH